MWSSTSARYFVAFLLYTLLTSVHRCRNATVLAHDKHIDLLRLKQLNQIVVTCGRNVKSFIMIHPVLCRAALFYVKHKHIHLFNVTGKSLDTRRMKRFSHKLHCCEMCAMFPDFVLHLTASLFL